MKYYQMDKYYGGDILAKPTGPPPPLPAPVKPSTPPAPPLPAPVKPPAPSVPVKPPVPSQKGHIELATAEYLGETNIGHKILLLIAGIAIMVIGSVSVDMMNDCEKYKDGNTYIHHKRFLSTTLGIGVGLVLFALLKGFIDYTQIEVLGLIITILSSIAVISQNKLANECSSDTDLQTDYRLWYGLLGCGIGLLSFGLVMYLIGKTGIKNGPKIVSMVANILSLTIGSVAINLNGKCEVKKTESNKNRNFIWISIAVNIGLIFVTAFVM